MKLRKTRLSYARPVITTPYPAFPENVFCGITETRVPPMMLP